jgi:single-strand DNA-binding protein
MNSFTLTAVGNLARNPEAVAKGDLTYTRLRLVGNDYAGKDEKGAPREIVTSLSFVAFGPLGEALVHNARKGDQLIIEAQVRANNWTDKQGEKQYDYDFVVQGFRFGAPGKAKREEFNGRAESGGKSDHDGNSELDGKAPSLADAKTKDAKSGWRGEVAVGGGPIAMVPGTSLAGENDPQAPEAGAPAGGGTLALRTGAAAKNGAMNSERPSSQRAGRRTNAPPS